MGPTKSSKNKVCTELGSVLDDAVPMVPELRRTSSLKACLAEKVLTLAAEGESDPAILARVAVRTVQESLQLTDVKEDRRATCCVSLGGDLNYCTRKASSLENLDPGDGWFVAPRRTRTRTTL